MKKIILIVCISYFSIISAISASAEKLSSTIPHGTENMKETVRDFQDAGIIKKEHRIKKERSDFQLTIRDRIFHEKKYQSFIKKWLAIILNKDEKKIKRQIKKIYFNFSRDNLQILIEQRLLKTDLINIPGEINLKIKTEAPGRFRISLQSLNIADVNIVSVVNLISYFRDKVTNKAFENEYFLCELFTDLIITVKPALLQDYLGINGEITELRVSNHLLLLRIDLK